MPDSGRRGRFGPYGGQYVPETVMPCLAELEEAYRIACNDKTFEAELQNLLQHYSGRPTPLDLAANLSRELGGGVRVYLKREDLNHTGAHKINNCLGQVLLAVRMGKQRIVAETGAGQHGGDRHRLRPFRHRLHRLHGSRGHAAPAPHVERMELLGAEVREVRSGTRTLKDATSEAIRDWVTRVQDTHYIIGSTVGPHPYPTMVRDFQAVIGHEARGQILDARDGCPTTWWPAWAAAPTPWASSRPSSTMPTCGCTASRPAARRRAIPRPSDAAAPACCTGRSAT